MCGICGIVDLSNDSIDMNVLLSMRDSIAHRGPDSAGVNMLPHIGLGHRRLAVIDLSPQAHQPMSNTNGTVWVSFNGEIYNHHELRYELEQLGHSFRSRSDTEAILHAYEEWGDHFAEKLIGMFALAIWDQRSNTLRLARDRLGVKPLFYVHQGHRFYFSSEVHPLYRFVPPMYATVDRLSLANYLSFGYVPADRTLIRGIEKLSPGHMLKYGEGNCQCWRYWEVPNGAPKSWHSLHEVLEVVDEKLHTAVKRRLESDVPLGTFLSGGIDSGLVTAIAAQHSQQPLRTFSVGFGDKNDVDERPLARQVANRYGTQHTELKVDFNVASILPHLLWNCGEPFADISLLPTYAISKAARAHITVALSGDGGDESFGGYANVYAAYQADRWFRFVPKSMLSTLYNNGQRFTKCGNVFSKAQTILLYASQPLQTSYNWKSWWHTDIQRELMAAEWAEAGNSANPLALIEVASKKIRSHSKAEQQLYMDLSLRLPGDYLTKIDVASNFVALEVRSPFLDHELVEVASQIPISLRMLHGRQKGLLRQLAERYLPNTIVKQPKRGFGTNWGRWLRNEWAPLVDRFVTHGIANRPMLVNPNIVRRVVHEHQLGIADHTQRLWALLCLEIWWQLFVEKSLNPTESI